MCWVYRCQSTLMQMLAFFKSSSSWPIAVYILPWIVYHTILLSICSRSSDILNNKIFVVPLWHTTKYCVFYNFWRTAFTGNEIIGRCSHRRGRCIKMRWIFLPNSTNDWNTRTNTLFMLSEQMEKNFKLPLMSQKSKCYSGFCDFGKLVYLSSN